WSPGPALPLEVKQTTWQVNRDPWMLGSNPAQSVRVRQSFRPKPDHDDKQPESEIIRKIMGDMKRPAAARPPRIDRLDINGDGREDLMVWESSGKLDFKTDLYLFLRGADQQWPERPTQILHCRGFPIPVG